MLRPVAQKPFGRLGRAVRGVPQQIDGLGSGVEPSRQSAEGVPARGEAQGEPRGGAEQTPLVQPGRETGVEQGGLSRTGRAHQDQRSCPCHLRERGEHPLRHAVAPEEDVGVLHPEGVQPQIRAAAGRRFRFLRRCRLRGHRRVRRDDEVPRTVPGLPPGQRTLAVTHRTEDSVEHGVQGQRLCPARVAVDQQIDERTGERRVRGVRRCEGQLFRGPHEVHAVRRCHGERGQGRAAAQGGPPGEAAVEHDDDGRRPARLQRLPQRGEGQRLVLGHPGGETVGAGRRQVQLAVRTEQTVPDEVDEQYGLRPLRLLGDGPRHGLCVGRVEQRAQAVGPYPAALGQGRAQIPARGGDRGHRGQQGALVRRGRDQ